MAASQDWLARTRQAGQLLAQGRAVEAVPIFEEVARANPRLPDAQNNLAVALKAAGRLKEAVDGYRRALKLNPDYDVARLNLARGFRELGQHENALLALAVSLHRRPDDEEVWFEAQETLHGMHFERPSPAARELLLRVFGLGTKDMQPLVGPISRLVLSNRRIARVIAAASQAYPDGDPGLFLAPREIGDALLTAMLTWTIVPDPDVEAWITLARRQLLGKALDNERIDSDRALLWAIAAQCQATELAPVVSAEEIDQARSLATGLDADEDAKIAIAGMYVPLESLPVAAALGRRAASKPADMSPRQVLVRREIVDREAERRTAESLPALTAIQGETSSAVRAQYESNPYPRWLTVERERAPITLAERVAKRFPKIATGGLDLVTPRIMVAGCGTGRHAVTTAARHAGCQVLAVDLSRASLAYAKRRAEVLGQRNVAFRQADILELSALEDRFDLIESSGVLHHMADPMAGWRVLRGLMKPRGLMRIGLYSAHARSRWNSLRETIPCGLEDGQIEAFIRDRRAALLAARPKGPEAVVLRIADFYSLSGCRDLLFHASEIHYTIPEIASALDDLGLEFLGFENLSKAVSDGFAARFASVGADRDLASWDAFERDNPDTFIAMYQFWCQART